MSADRNETCAWADAMRKVAIAALLITSACSADKPGEGGRDGGMASGSRDAGTVLTCTAPNPGPTPLRRLTRAEYDRTVRDLVGDTTMPAATSFLPDGVAFGFDNNAVAQSMTLALAEQQFNAAEVLAAQITSDADRLRNMLPCDPASAGQRACGEAFIEDFVPRAWRRPLMSNERSRLQAVLDVGLETSFRAGIRLVVTAALASPNFLYRVELGLDSVGTDVVALSSYEVASRLSYFLWGSMPDQALFDKAARGELASAEQIRTEAERMLSDPRADDALDHFAEQWLEIEGLKDAVKDETLFPEFSVEARAAMQRGTLQFHREVVLGEEPGTVDDLFTASYAFLNRSTAALADVPGVTSRDVVKTPLDPNRRAGILTDLSVLTAHAKANQTSPVLRGKFVREQLLCTPLPNPPDTVDITPPEPRPGATTRERFDEHRANPACAGCHQLMDPIGFGFESYDAIGRFRTEDNGIAVDATGEVHAVAEGTIAFDGAVELAGLLADNDAVRTCVAQQWFRYAFGRVESTDDGCSLQSANAAFRASGYRIRDLLVALTQTDAFRYRRSITTAGCQ